MLFFMLKRYLLRTLRNRGMMGSLLKSDIRLQLKLKLCNQDKKIFLKKSHELSKRLYDYLLTHSLVHKTVGAYAPIGDEVMWELSLPLGEMELAFPFCNIEGEMKFSLSLWDELSSKKQFGVKLRVPNCNAIEVTPDILIIPALGWGIKGERLGRGGGFYDRYLSDFKGLKIGVGFEKQIIEQIPMDEHDIYMDLIVTENTIYKIRS